MEKRGGYWVGGRSVRQYLGNVSAQEAASYAVVKCITQYFHMATAVAASTQTEFRIRLLFNTHDVIPCSSR